MAFKASKTRQRRALEPVGRGSAIVPNAAIKNKYQRSILNLVGSMIEEYRASIEDLFEHEQIRDYYAEDASVTDRFKKRMEVLRRRWESIFEAFADKAAPNFVNDVEKHATAATLNSLRTAGLQEPRALFNEYVQNTLESAVDFNHTLITEISKEAHGKIYEAVMLSLTSPNPEQQGQGAIEKAVREAGVDARDRVELIARDQTSKLYSALSDERMRQNGCEEYEWLHSSAGKVPRKSHERMNGHIFKLNDPRVWEVGGEFDLKKSDLGPPGWAINCRCRRVPVFR